MMLQQRCSDVAIATNHWKIHATRLQRCELHRMQQKIGFKIKNYSNVAETLLLKPTIKTSMQPSCVASCLAWKWKIKLKMWGCRNVSYATNNSNLNTTLPQRCKLHLLQPKIELTIWCCSNVVATLQVQPIIENSMQPGCKVASCTVCNQKLGWKWKVAATLHAETLQLVPNIATSMQRGAAI